MVSRNISLTDEVFDDGVWGGAGVGDEMLGIGRRSESPD